MRNKKDFYEILDIPRTASVNEIKKAYRQLALQYHPDRNQTDPKAEEKFKEASEAYSVLGNPEKREIYDKYGHDGLRAGNGGPADFSFFSDSVFSDFGDILGNLFGFGSVFSGSQRHSRRPRQGRDLGMEVVLTFAESFHGVEKEINLHRERNCTTCQGSGAEPGTSPETCPQCRGTGQVHRSQGFFTVATTCGRCRGSGKTVAHPCKDCKGSGHMEEIKTLKVSFPAGIDAGQRLRISGEGEEGSNGGPPGDMYLLIQVGEHDRFRREEDDLIHDLKISFPQAVLGVSLPLLTLDGEERIEVPPGILSGDVLRLKGKGFKRINRMGKGDLLIHVRVVTPKNPGRREKELYKELQDLEDSQKSVSKGAKKGFLH